MAKGGLGSLRTGVFDEVKFFLSALKEKGPKHYLRPFAICFGLVFGIYKFIYEPPKEQYARIRQDLVAAAATVKYAESYKDLKFRLDLFKERLPPAENTAAWLLETVRESMKAEGISFTSLSPVSEANAGAYTLYSISLGCRGSYKQIGSWIARLERTKQLLHVSALGINKDKEEIGMNEVQVTISAAVPVEGKKT